MSRKGRLRVGDTFLDRPEYVLSSERRFGAWELEYRDSKTMPILVSTNIRRLDVHFWNEGFEGRDCELA
jgi:hypothetical protein